MQMIGQRLRVQRPPLHSGIENSNIQFVVLTAAAGQFPGVIPSSFSAASRTSGQVVESGSIIS